MSAGWLPHAVGCLSLFLLAGCARDVLTPMEAASYKRRLIQEHGHRLLPEHVAIIQGAPVRRAGDLDGMVERFAREALQVEAYRRAAERALLRDRERSEPRGEAGALGIEVLRGSGGAAERPGSREGNEVEDE